MFAALNAGPHGPGAGPITEPIKTMTTQTLWSIQEVSGYLQIPVSSIYKMTARKAGVRIPHIRIGKKLRFRQSDVDLWLRLLTVSNLETISRMRQKVSAVSHGENSQTQT